MLRITDMTLTCLEPYGLEPAQLRQVYGLLLRSGADYIEMPAALYEKLRPAETSKLVLRLPAPEAAAQYPEISRFVCRKNGYAGTGAAVMQEVQLNDVKEIAFPGLDTRGSLRVVGLDDVLAHDYKTVFSKLLKRAGSNVEFCPENGFYCATAAAVEWVLCGGRAVAAAFGGLGGKAALEEVLLALHVVRRHRPGASFSSLPQLARLLEELIAVRFSDRKAVIGRCIFNVESGIHVDGILKKPQMYEPFLPELVGGCRRFVIGKHSGRKSVAAKLNELGVMASDFDIPRLLAAVREESVRKRAGLTDEEFMAIAERHRL